MTVNLDKTGLKSIINDIDLLFIDIWGVLHNGIKLYDESLNVLDQLEQSKKEYILLTNAPRPNNTVINFLKNMGLDESKCKKVSTSGEVALKYLRSKYKIEVFFNEDLSNEEAIGLIHKIKKINGVRNATLITKEDAVRIFKDQFGEDILSILGYNPLPISAVVNLKRNSEEVLDATPIVNKIKKMDGVEEVRYQGHLIKKIERTYARAMKIFPWVALVFNL